MRGARERRRKDTSVRRWWRQVQRTSEVLLRERRKAALEKLESLMTSPPPPRVEQTTKQERWTRTNSDYWRWPQIVEWWQVVTERSSQRRRRGSPRAETVVASQGQAARDTKYQDVLRPKPPTAREGLNIPVLGRSRRWTHAPPSVLKGQELSS